MLKRSFVLSALLMLFCMLPNVSFAYTGGHMDGAAMYLSATTSGGNPVTDATDDNINTYVQLEGYDKGTDTLIFNFPSASTVASYQYLAVKDSASAQDEVRMLITHDGGSYTAAVSDGTRTNIEPALTGVTRVLVLATNTNLDIGSKVYEVNLYDVPYVPDITPPTVPTNFAATPHASQAIIYLTFNGSTDTVSGVSGYNVYRDNVKITSTPHNSVYFTDQTGLSLGTTYSYQITAVDNSGNESARTTAVSATTVSAPDTTPPAVPTGVQVAPQDGSILVSWSAVSDSDLAGFHVYLNDLKVTTTPITATELLVTALTNGTSYSFKVSSVDTTGNESARTAAVIGVPVAVVAPTQPKNLKATVANNKVVLMWDVVASAIKYFVYRDGVKVGETTTLPYTDTSVINGVSYNYAVSAVNDDGESIKSLVKTAKPSDIADLTDIRLPFSVGDMLGTARNFLGLFPSWIILALGIFFSPVLFAIVMQLFGYDGKKKGRYKVGRDGKVTKEKSERERSEKSKQDRQPTVYRSTGERDKDGNRIRVTQKQYDKLNKGQTKERSSIQMRQPREKRKGMAETVYRSTGERDKDGNRIRVTQRQYDKLERERERRK